LTDWREFQEINREFSQAKTGDLRAALRGLDRPRHDYGSPTARRKPILKKPMAFYLLNLYYPNLRTSQTQVMHAKKIVKAAAGREWRTVGVGEQALSICFVCDVTPKVLRDKLRPLDSETFSYLLVELAAIVAGSMDTTTMQWWSGHLPQGCRAED
jgi:hypothetical protein